MKNKCALFLSMMLMMNTAAATAEYPVTLTDQAGRTVLIEAEPSSLVSGYYIASSALIALEQADKLVGIEAKASSRAIYALSAPALLQLPSVGTAKQFDIEGCAALQPDLIVLPLKLKTVIEPLESLGFTVLLVDPENTERMTGMVHLLAEATGRQQRGEDLITSISAIQQLLNERLEGVERPSVYLAGNASLLSTAGGAMYQNSLIELAGGENTAAAVNDVYWANISIEQLLAWDPQVIILASDASYTCDDVLQNKDLAYCKAVKNECVYQLPGHLEAWDSPVPGSVLGAVWLAAVLHPDKVSMEDYHMLAGEFYETYYGVEFTQE